MSQLPQTRGKTAQEAEKSFDEWKESITNAVSTSLNKSLDDLKDLITNRDTGVEPRLTHIEEIVEKNPNALVEEVDSIRSIVGPTPDTPPSASLQQQIIDLKQQLTTLQNSEASVDKLQSRELEVKVNALCQAMGVLEDKVNSHESRIISNSASILSNNIKIGALAETPDEDPYHVVSTFFENIMGLTPGDGDIVEASRMKGELRRKIKGAVVTLPKLMYVRCSPAFRVKVDRNKHLLKDKFDETSKMRYSIRPHLPEAHYAVRQKFNEKVKSIIKDNAGKEEKDRVSFSFRGEDFYIDKFKVVDKIQPPSLQDACSLSLTERDTLDRLSFFVSEPKTVKNSKFQAYAISVYSLEQIKAAYLKMRKDHLRATHICLGYRYADGGLNAPVLHGSSHDGEYLADIRLLDTLFKAKINNVAVFVVRRYGGVHIGGTRLSLIQETANDALNQLRDARGETFSEPASGDETDAASVASSQLAVVQEPPEGEDKSSRRKRKAGKKGGRGRGAKSGRGRGSFRPPGLNSPYLDFDYL